MSLAHMTVEMQQLDLRNIVESRFEPTEELDIIHQLKDGSYVYEENQRDWNDETGRTKIFSTFYLSNLANFSSFEKSNPPWEDFDEETEFYYEDLEAYDMEESFCNYLGEVI